jgi:hypothetical protein
MTSIRFLGGAGTVTGPSGPPPKVTFLVPGERASLASASSRLNTMGWTNRVPVHMEEVALS